MKKYLKGGSSSKFKQGGWINKYLGGGELPKPIEYYVEKYGYGVNPWDMDPETKKHTSDGYDATMEKLMKGEEIDNRTAAQIISQLSNPLKAQVNKSPLLNMEVEQEYILPVNKMLKEASIFGGNRDIVNKYLLNKKLMPRRPPVIQPNEYKSGGWLNKYLNGGNMKSKNKYSKSICKECGGMLPHKNLGGNIIKSLAPAAQLLNLVAPGLGVGVSAGLNVLGDVVNTIPGKQENKPQALQVPMTVNANKYGQMEDGGNIGLTGVGIRKGKYIPLFPKGGYMKGIPKGVLSFDGGYSPYEDEGAYISPNYRRNFISDEKAKHFRGEGIVPYFKLGATGFPFVPDKYDSGPPAISTEAGADFNFKHFKASPYVGYNFNGPDKGQYSGLDLSYTPGKYKDEVKFPMGVSMSSDSKRGSLVPHLGVTYNPKKRGYTNLGANIGYDVIENRPVGSFTINQSFKKGGWIQKAINPKHKGYCTPMTKSTCTPHRKALAMRFKHGDLHKKDDGGILGDLERGDLEINNQPRMTNPALWDRHNDVLRNIDNGDIFQYNGPSHAQGGIMINGMGVPVNNPNDAIAEVEGGENYDYTNDGGFIQSDSSGFDKYGNVTYKDKDVVKTFADSGRKNTNGVKGRTDEISMVHKNLVNSIIRNKNNEALQMKERDNQNKFNRALQRFTKKYGGNLAKYSDGSFVFPKYDSNNPIGDPNENFNSDNIPNPYIPPIGTDFGIPNGELKTPESYNPLDFGKLGNTILNYAPAISNGIFALESAFSKSHNSQEQVGPQEELTYQGLNTKIDNQAPLQRNRRLFDARNKYAQIYTPSVANSIMSNTASEEAYANNDIFDKAHQLEKQLEFQKAGLIGNAQRYRNTFDTQGKHQYAIEQEQDRQARLEGLQTNVNTGLKNLQDLRYDKEALAIMPQGWSYVNFDPSTNLFSYKDQNGALWYIDRSTKQKVKG